METKANFALIGAFVVAVFIALVLFVVWLSGSEFDQQFDEYIVEFTGPVRGLSVGGDVRYNGLSVGEVTDLNLDPENSNIVRATVEIDANTPVQSNSFARLEPQGLTGLSYLQIFSGGDEFPLLRDLDGPAIIPGEMSTLDNILETGDDVVQNATIALQRVTQLLNEEAVADFQGILSNVNTITGNLAAAELDEQSIQRLVDTATTAAADLSTTLQTWDGVGRDVRVVLDEQVEPLAAQAEAAMTDFQALVANANGTLVEYEALAREGQLLAVDSRDAINRLSTSGLTDLEETTESLRQLAASLSRISSQLERSPLEFIAGAERERVEIPQ